MLKTSCLYFFFTVYFFTGIGGMRVAQIMDLTLNHILFLFCIAQLNWL